MNIKPEKYCDFCERKSKVKINDYLFCPNGHFLVKDGFLELLQPRSEGNIEGENIYRLNDIDGEFCNEEGKLI